MRQPNPREVSAANQPFGRSSRSGRAVWYPPPLGRAEQRSSVRIKTLALFERSEFASVPNAASSARNPKGTDVARLFFGEAKKSNSPAGARPGLSPEHNTASPTNTTKNSSLLTFFQQRKRKQVARRGETRLAPGAQHSQPNKHNQKQFFAYFLSATPKESKSPAVAKPG